MESAILFGNGINRCFDGMSWKSLLARIANSYFVGTDDKISSTIAYEKIANKILSNNVKLTEETFAYDILKNLDSLKKGYSNIYTVFLSLPIENYMTTNYDYAIERSLITDFEYSKFTKNVTLPQEIKCSRLRHITLNGKRIFHIHGELSKPTSICLGTVHYATNLNKLMEYIVYTDESGNSTLRDDIFSGGSIQTWAEYFFTKNIYIVGLGLYDCDFDLWWLITYRAQLLTQGDSRIKNTITYYYLHEGDSDHEFKDCLETFYIKVKENTIDDNQTWNDAYIRVANDIKKQIADN